jgi:peptide/nickel transport system substrate-binding protein
MGCRRGRTAGQEVVSFRAVARCSRVYRRRAILRIWCGVVFSTFLSACHEPASSSVTPTVLTIGFPEGRVVGADLGMGQLITAFTQEGLTQISVDGRPLPRLAASWRWEKDGLALRVSLRPGVRFHDGTPLTPSVAASALSQAMERPGNRALYPFLDDITSVRPEGELDLVLELSRRSVLLPEELELPLSVGPENDGAGAFRLISRNPSEVVFQSFGEYHLGAPEVERIVIRAFDSLRPAWASLLRGEVDMVTDVPPDALEFVQNDDIQVISFARRYQFMVVFNSGRFPFSSSTVRRALNAAIDRDRLIRNVLQGRGEAAMGPLWPRHWAYDTSIQPFAFDPRNAASLLDSAGFRLKEGITTAALPARLRFTCLLPENFALLERLALELQKQLYDVGVDIQFETVPIQDYNSRIRDGQFDAVLVDMISGPSLARPYVFWRSAGSRRLATSLNVFGYENDEAERLFNVVRTSTNEAAVRSAVSRLQRAFLEDPPALFLVWNQRARALSRRFRVATSDRDPLFTIGQWTENTDRPSISTQ